MVPDVNGSEHDEFSAPRIEDGKPSGACHKNFQADQDKPVDPPQKVYPLSQAETAKRLRKLGCEHVFTDHDVDFWAMPDGRWFTVTPDWTDADVAQVEKQLAEIINY